MKKLFCVIISLALMFSAFACIGVNAAATTFSLNSAQCNYGKSATLDLSVADNTVFAAAVIDLTYNASAIRLNSVSSSSFECDFSVNTTGARITLFDLDNTSAVSGVIASLEFVSINGADDYIVDMSAEIGNICDADGNEVSATFTSGTITVFCDHYYVYDHTTDATCDKLGEIVYVCRRCNSERITYIEKVAHTDGPWVTVKQPDCVNKGQKNHICAVCESVLETQEIAALGHVFGEELVDVEPTCTKDGVSYKLCKVCNHEEYGVIAAAQHSNAVWRTTSPAGCEAGGIASLVCEDCSEVLDTKTIDATGHLYGWVITEQPTCNKEGVNSYICLICGEVEKTETIEKLEHTEGFKAVTKEATCTEDGVLTTYCDVCGEVANTSVIDKKGHTPNRLTVITAPSANSTGVGKYYCKVCGIETGSVTLDKTNASITAGSVSCFVGDSIKIPVTAQNNPGFSAGVLRITYNVKDLVYKGIETVGVSDIMVSVTANGELTVLMCPDNANVTANGVWFNLLFDVADGAETNTVALNYRPNDDFADADGNHVFFNLTSAEVEVNKYILGDLNYDKSVNAADLAAMKKMVAGLAEPDYDITADVVVDGFVNAADLAALKKYIAGYITSFN